tara:strand:+ start:1523 stop:1897 length:375 start_codon:yes stop_codon:yes gene_type:complete
MIKGIGIDLVDKYRFRQIIQKYGNKFAYKILSNSEYVEYKEISNKESFLSKRFAAKEAFSKAIGCGLYRNGIYPNLIAVQHDKFGKPFLSFSVELKSFIAKKYTNIHLSITDSDNQSIAFVTLE